MQNLTNLKERKNAKIDNDKLCFNSVTDEEKKCTNKENNACGVCKLVSETQLILKRFTKPFESRRRIVLSAYHCLYELKHQRGKSRCLTNGIAAVE